MCHFASFVVTKKSVYYLENSDSHEDIIEQNKLLDDEFNLVRVELLPPENIEDISDVTKWTFEVDQDYYPGWTYKGDPVLESQARQALERRIKEQNIGNTIRGGIGSVLHVGTYGTIIMQKDSIGIAGYHGKVYGGNECFGRAGDFGVVDVGNYSEAIAGAYGTAVAGYMGKAIACHKGTAIVGDAGQAFVGLFGKAKAGIDGIINIMHLQSPVHRQVVGVIGENGLKPNVFYRLINEQFVEYES